MIPVEMGLTTRRGVATRSIGDTKLNTKLCLDLEGPEARESWLLETDSEKGVEC